MFAAGYRSRVSLRRLAHYVGYARDSRSLREKVFIDLRTYFRVSIIVGTLLIATGVSALSSIFPGTEESRKRRSLLIMQKLSRFILRAMNIQCQIDLGKVAGLGEHKPTLYLPNHISYLDAILIFAHMPTIFVTSREIEENIVLGSIARGAGCLFIERRHRFDVMKDINQISYWLNKGFNVVLFPEGTTSTGEELLHFKPTLIQAAIYSRCRVCPVVIEYTAVDGEKYGLENRDYVAWYGDMKFFPHLLRFASRRRVDVRVNELPEIPIRYHRSRKKIAAEVKKSISEELSSLPEKRQKAHGVIADIYP